MNCIFFEQTFKRKQLTYKLLHSVFDMHIFSKLFKKYVIDSKHKLLSKLCKITTGPKVKFLFVNYFNESFKVLLIILI